MEKGLKLALKQGSMVLLENELNKASEEQQQRKIVKCIKGAECEMHILSLGDNKQWALVKRLLSFAVSMKNTKEGMLALCSLKDKDKNGILHKALIGGCSVHCHLKYMVNELYGCLDDGELIDIFSRQNKSGESIYDLVNDMKRFNCKCVDYVKNKINVSFDKLDDNKGLSKLKFSGDLLDTPDLSKYLDFINKRMSGSDGSDGTDNINNENGTMLSESNNDEHNGNNGNIGNNKNSDNVNDFFLDSSHGDSNGSSNEDNNNNNKMKISISNVDENKNVRNIKRRKVKNRKNGKFLKVPNSQDSDYDIYDSDSDSESNEMNNDFINDNDESDDSDDSNDSNDSNGNDTGIATLVRDDNSRFCVKNYVENSKNRKNRKNRKDNNKQKK